MKIPPFFSIITPTYNRGEFLIKAIESVLNQTLKDWEYIIIDDGSTDNTAEIIASFNDNRITYLYQENQERSAARNNGINLAKGQYICFLDSDDYYLSHHLESLYREISYKKNPIAFFYTKSKIHRGSEKTYYPMPNNSDNFARFIWQNHISINSTCFHHHILEIEQFPPYDYWEDRHLFIRIAIRYPVFLINTLTTVVIHHNQQSIYLSNNKNIIFSTKKFIKCIESFDVINNINDFISPKERYSLIIKEISDRFLIFISKKEIQISVLLFLKLIQKLSFQFLGLYLSTISKTLLILTKRMINFLLKLINK